MMSMVSKVSGWKTIREFFRSHFPRIVFFALISVLCVLPVTSQSFPEGSTQGNTEMSERITGIDFPNIEFSASAPKDGHEVAFSVQLLILLTLLTLAPSLLILTTTFLRFSIVLDFIKRALSLQQVPPTAVLNGIAIFMTIFCMWPTFKNMYDNALRPMSNNEITLEQAYEKAEAPLRTFMYQQMKDDPSYITTFLSMTRTTRPKNISEVPTYVLVPAYILHELTVAFKIGVLLYIPFIIIDMVVASILMSMGMMMLPPVQISMPFKLMLFVLVDGWGLLTTQLFHSVGL